MRSTNVSMDSSKGGALGERGHRATLYFKMLKALSRCPPATLLA